MSSEPASIGRLVEDLSALGVRAGQVLLTHASFRAVGSTEGGPLGLIEALGRSVGSSGTLVMPSWSSAFDEPFDPACSEVASGLGVVAKLFWRQPDVLRSRGTPFAFAARGADAADIVSGGLLLPPHQPQSPVDKVLSKDGRILLLGLNHASNTSLHLAEWLAGVPYRKEMQITVSREGAPERVAYVEPRHCFGLYAQADAWLEGVQQRGRVGAAEARLVRAHDLIEIAVAKLRQDPLRLLHSQGSGCEPCDEARRSIAQH